MKNEETTEILTATEEELRLIARLTARPVFERVDARELEIVDAEDWSDVPELEGSVALRVPRDLYDQMIAASRNRHTTPDRLAAHWLADRLKAL